MKKLFSFLALICLLFAFCAPAAFAEDGAVQETEFTLRFYDHGDGTVDLEILTNQAHGVGGLHIEVYPEVSMWTVDAALTKAFVDQADISADETRAAFAWDSIEDVELPESLFRTTLHAKTDTYDVSQIHVRILDYYDNTLAMNDLAYYFQADLVSGKAKPLYNAWLILLCMLLVLVAVAALFMVNRRCRYAVQTVLLPRLRRLGCKISRAIQNLKQKNQAAS